MGFRSGHGHSDEANPNEDSIISNPHSHGLGISMSSIRRKPISDNSSQFTDATQSYQYSQFERREPSSDVPLMGAEYPNDKAPISTSVPIGDFTIKEQRGKKTEGLHWWFEVISLFVCIAAFGGAICVLAIYQGEPISRWKSATISLNTVLSVLATISRASLAFVVGACIAQGKWNWFGKYGDQLIHFDRLDDASKGLYGSFRLLWSFFRRPHWVALGAFTTIILLGYEAFLQAGITYDDGVILLGGDFHSDSNAAIPAVDATSNKTFNSHAYAGIGTCQRLESGLHKVSLGSGTAQIPFTGPDGKKLAVSVLRGYETRVDLGMTAAIWNGFSHLVSEQNLWPSFSCASGNCTWSPFTSIAVCAQCNDISSHIQKFSGTTKIPALSIGGGDAGWQGTPPDISNKQYWSVRVKAGKDSKVPYTKYQIPEIGLNISNFNGPPLCATNDTACSDTYLTAKMITNPGLTFTFQDLKSMIIAVQMIGSNESYQNNETNWEDTLVTAQECSLRFCVNVYETAVEKGLLKQSVIGSWSNKTQGSYESTFDFSNITLLWDAYNNDTLDHGEDSERTDLELFIPANDNPKTSSFGGQTYNITQSTIASMIKFLVNDFGGESMPASDKPSRFNDSSGLYWYPSLGYLQPPGFMLGLGESRNVSQTFENAALSLNKWMQDVAYQKSPLQGEMTETVVIVKVQWKYLTWPALTILIGFIFAILSITETKRLGLPAWKGSVLATIAHGGDVTVKERFREAPLTESVWTTSRDVQVKLEYPEGEAGLVVVRGQSSGGV